MRMPLKWEFPGGKIEVDESEVECVKREIREEINIMVEVVKRLEPSYYEYPSFKINLIPFVAKYISGEIKLAEHSKYRLLKIDELNELDWAEADLPIVRQLSEFSGFLGDDPDI